ncbi:MAG TPA: hypothetical protein PK997_01855 [Candidatus Omnitrophota bacterium]|jgi:hypothetical protein|nr:MAG: hypothetical protein BWY49_00373 [Candidatus Omnitrophica bacterium ADurb.Bin314]HOE69327.1 hypothetical protein [Candidatus Omnitrophota bacterium]HPW64975.1 hypothetical protein [Candidatus Omnitrophota bacterium]HQB93932.1 hypothetical protein [Candidatus Omnitrophota bacterium]
MDKSELVALGIVAVAALVLLIRFFKKGGGGGCGADCLKRKGHEQ